MKHFHFLLFDFWCFFGFGFSRFRGNRFRSGVRGNLILCGRFRCFDSAAAASADSGALVSDACAGASSGLVSVAVAVSVSVATVGVSEEPRSCSFEQFSISAFTAFLSLSSLLIQYFPLHRQFHNPFPAYSLRICLTGSCFLIVS